MLQHSLGENGPPNGAVVEAFPELAQGWIPAADVDASDQSDFLLARLTLSDDAMGTWSDSHHDVALVLLVDPQLGEALTRLTIRVAVACYVGRVLLDVSGAARPVGAIAARKAARCLWTIGCGLYLVHVFAAFAFFHAWSHDAAYRHTAETTRAVVGVDWGGGLYVNYAFTLLWGVDAILWWLGGVGFAYRSRAYYWLVHGVFALMVVNATVVFGPPHWRWVTLVVVVVIAAAYCVRRFHADESRHDDFRNG